MSHLVRPPGFSRAGVRPERWLDPAGSPVTSADTLARLRGLAIPPAWEHVWASPDPDSPVQATGVDSRGRTQYRYARAAQAFAANLKFEHMLAFAGALPALRLQVAADLRGDPAGAPPTATGRAVAATVIRLLEKGMFRVGNERYVRDNHTYGVTTIRRSQLSLEGDTATFEFVGKEHLSHTIAVRDPDVAAVIRHLLAQPRETDAELFAVEGESGWHRIDSAAVNAYLHSHTGAPATAKVFRTWGATVAAAAVVAGASGPGASGGRGTTTELRAIRSAADLLGDTPAVARSAYVHPLALAAGRDEAVIAAVDESSGRLGTRDVQELFFDATLQAAVLTALSSLTSLLALPPPPRE